MGVVLIIISVDSDDEEATVRGVLAEAGLSFTIQRGRVYAGGGGSDNWSPGASVGGGGSGGRSGTASHAGTSGDNGQGGCAGGGRGGYTTGSGGAG